MSQETASGNLVSTSGSSGENPALNFSAPSYRISPPEEFDFSKPNEWPKWIKRFERFRSASGLNRSDSESQVNTLLYTMGSKSDDIMPTFVLSAEEAKNYEVVKDRFEKHFVKKRNVIYERAKFNRRKQELGESVNSFITDLYGLAEHCQFGTLHDELIRDRIVVGLLDQKLSEKLQLVSDLTLEKAINSARQTEAVKTQQSVVRGNSDPATTKTENIDMLSKARKFKPNKSRPEQKKFQKKNPEQNSTRCGRCGRSPTHTRAQCPASCATCRKCSKKGHYEIVCRSNKVNVVMDNESYFLDAVSLDEIDSPSVINPWKVKANTNGYPIEFKLDTGADVSVIPESVFKKLKCELSDTKRTLTGPSQQKLHVMGTFTAHIKVNENETKQEIFVVKGLKSPLLGRPAITALKLVSVVHTVRQPFDQLVHDKHPKLFSGLGKLEGKYHIRLKENPVPYAVTTPRRVALPLLPKVKEKLEQLEKQGVISRVDQPTDWCAPIVVVPKSSGDVRLCVDLTKLNEQVKRERLVLPAVDDVLAQLSGARVFSKLDANSGFYQIELTEESSFLTTFITPFGRYCYNRLPFGITSAPEHFQKRMQSILSGMKGTVNMIDDILVYGKDQEEHDERLEKVLTRIEEAGITLSVSKCEFSKNKVTFLGHVVDATGVRPDPAKIKAISEMPEPTNVKELRRFLGMANQLSKFSPKLAETSKPLRDLLSKKNMWSWESPQKNSFSEMKRILSSDVAVLAHYDPEADTRVSSDASSYGLGAVLEQRQKDNTWRPVAYQSRSLSSCEIRYAQIEKEALAITWACERFNNYLLGKSFQIQTDHKPLIYLLSSAKDMDCLPPRIQRFKLRLMRYQFSIIHVPGKQLTTADTLSRAPVSEPLLKDFSFEEDCALYVNNVIQSLPASEHRLEEIKVQLQEDEICSQIMTYCKNGWPSNSTLKGPIKAYKPFATEFTVQHGLLLRGSRLVIPASMRSNILEKLHTGHQGIVKCRMRARESVWWPGISKQLEELIDNCPTCRKFSRNRVEPMIATKLPDYPWQKVASDLFEFKGKTYLLVVDYYSRYIEVSTLLSTTSQTIISSLKAIFSRHGIPQVLLTDNGPQYASNEFLNFATSYNFLHVTSSPKYPQANGEAERAVQTVKRLFHKSTDPHLALLAYRTTPLQHGYSPAQLLMSRNLRTTVPILACQLKPNTVDYTQFYNKDFELKSKQQTNYDSRHRVGTLPQLTEGDPVYIPKSKTEGIVQREVGQRSWIISTPKGDLRRNRHHINQLPKVSADIPPTPPEQANLVPPTSCASTTHTIQERGTVKTRSGRTVRPPKKLGFE